MELIFLLIFVLFVFLNVILGLISSRAKKKKQQVAMGKPLRNKFPAEKSTSRRWGDRYESFLQPQTTESIMKPILEGPQQSSYESSVEISEEAAAAVEETAPLPGGERAGEEAAEPTKEPKEPFYPDRVKKLIEEERLRAEVREPMVDLADLTKSVRIPIASRETFPEIESRVEKSMDQGEKYIGMEPLPVTGVREVSSLWERVGVLPSLQKAVILSEILGKPKSISQ